MTDLERIREWIKGFEGIPEAFRIDYTHEVPHNAGLYPNGVQELRRRPSITGGITVTSQYNFGLYCVMDKPLKGDEQSARNAEWVMELQRWVQEQSARGLAPVFGNADREQEVIRAQNGQFYGNKEKGVGVYMVTLSVQFKTKYGV